MTMADVKYEHLPGLAPSDEPSLYETDDRAEVDQRYEVDEESSAVETIDISTVDGFNRFKDKTLDCSRVDFSDRLRRHVHTGYVAGSLDTETLLSPPQETVLQRYERLSAELQQLSQEVSGLKTAGSGSSDVISGQVEQLQKQLAALKVHELLDEKLQTLTAGSQSTLTSALETQLAQLSCASGSTAGDTSAASDGPTVYELRVNPRRVLAERSAQLGAVEQRLARMEAAVGATPQKMSRLSAETRHRCLLSAVHALSAKVSLLSPDTLREAEGRLTALHQRITTLSSAPPQQIEPHKLALITELHDKLKGVESTRGQLPAILDRLDSLQTLHQQAVEFSRCLAHMDLQQQRLDVGLNRCESELVRVRRSCSDSCTAATDMLKHIEQLVDGSGK